jgi:hypothetical protein
MNGSSVEFDYDSLDGAADAVTADADAQALAEAVRIALWVVIKGGHSDSAETRLAAAGVLAGIHTQAEAAKNFNLSPSSISRAVPHVEKLFRQLGMTINTSKS